MPESKTLGRRNTSGEILVKQDLEPQPALVLKVTKYAPLVLDAAVMSGAKQDNQGRSRGSAVILYEYLP
ncbi:hypothetical protein GJ744_012122 [Endocarpon pusillum]|uniref:Uncharacterized protein n=1 Tax=Endocarpon pusillum TaxID=364733 RepID=A0A8H7E2D8_9EURO|nr:hypothetical protein GJ744_012122 [Endocarpon pusillum]